MRCPSTIADENERLIALSEYGFGDEQPLLSLDPLVKVAARMFAVPVAAVNMIGSDHVFFAASIGCGECDMRRDVSFCAHAITQDDVMVVPDATLDARFHDNPLVTGSAGIRFYAGVPLRSPAGHALGALCIIDSRPHAQFSEQDRERLKDLAKLASDKLELNRLEVASRVGQPHFAKIAINSPNAIICFDQANVITVWNAAATEIFGYGWMDAIGQSIDLLVPVREKEAFRHSINGLFGGNTASEIRDFTGLRSNGSEFPLELSFSCWKEAGRWQFGAIVRDVTERTRSEEALYRLANYDELTGLTNRNVFFCRVADEIASGSAAAIILIDLDGFKDVNDSLGHAVGDGILREVAVRLLQCVRSTDTVSRIGGDEFAILLPKFNDIKWVVSISDAIIGAVARPVLLDGYDVRISASCGIAAYPLHGGEARELVGNADLALYQAKADGRGRSFTFVPALRMEAAARRLYDAELHRAVDNEEFVLFYQPQFRLSDGSLAGAEALIRWQHPERGLLSPAAFLPAIAGGSLATRVGTWVIDTACQQAAIWRAGGATDFRIGVNLFAAQFRGDDLSARISEILERHQLPPSALELEVTENIVLDHDHLVLQPLRRLREIGVCIAFDDFGTGYASLSLLKKYPLSRIKIDQSFVRSMCSSRGDHAIVGAIIDIARGFDVQVIAEGVETEEQLGLLRELQCDECQGYLLGKPMPPQLLAQRFGFGTTPFTGTRC